MFPIYFHFPIYFICHWKKFFLYNSPEFLKIFLGFFCCCQNVVQSNGTLIETLYFLFFNFKIDTQKLWAEKFVGQAWEGLQSFARNMEGAIVLSTQCEDMMLLKMFNWYMLYIYYIGLSWGFTVNFYWQKRFTGCYIKYLIRNTNH